MLHVIYLRSRLFVCRHCQNRYRGIGVGWIECNWLH